MTLSKILTATLGLQVLLAAVTWWPEPPPPEPRHILPFDVEAIDYLYLDSVSTRVRRQPIELTKKPDGDWVLSSHHDFPVRPGKVKEVLTAIQEPSFRVPITNSPLRHTQLLVDEESPTRRIKVRKGTEEAVVLLGAAIGQRMNVRYPGEPEVYQADNLAAWQVPDNTNAYFDSQQIAVDPANLATYSLVNSHGRLELVNRVDSFRLAGEESVELDQDRLQELMYRTLGLEMTNPADPNMVGPDLIEVSWTTKQGDTGGYAVVNATKNALIIARPGHPPFEAAGAIERQMLEGARRENLLLNSPNPEIHP